MNKDEALKLALEALKRATNYDPVIARAITAIKEALAQPEQEPVAWMNDMGTHIDLNVSGRGTPLYTTPPQRKPLTDEEIRDALEAEFLGSDEKRSLQNDLRVARAIEAAHGIKGEA